MRKTALSVLPILLLSVVSCLPPLTMAGKASIKVSFKSAVQVSKSLHAARTVVPPADLGIASLTVTVKDSGGATLGSGTASSISDTCIIPNIVPGAVTVSVSAANSSAVVVAGGSAPLTLGPGATQPVTINLAPTTTGSGSFAFAMSWPDGTGASYVDCMLYDSSDTKVDEQSPTVTDAAGTDAATYSKSGVTSGTYDMFITFKTDSGGAVLGAFVESVNIYDNLESDTWIDGSGNQVAVRAFSAQDMKDSLDSLTRLVITGAGFSNTYTASTIPALTTSSTIDLGRTSAVGITFTATLANTDSGQSIGYNWNGTASGTVGPDASSPVLALAATGTLNTLTITVTSSSGSSETYTVTMTRAYCLHYDANGATGGAAPADGFYLPTDTVTVSANTGSLVRTGYSFDGWNTAADGSGVSYSANDTLPSMTALLTLYAQWLKYGEVGVSFTVPSLLSVVFTYNGNTVTTLAVPRSGTPLVIGYGDTGSTVGNWKWYVNGGAPVGTAGSYSLDVSANGRYVVSCSAMKDGVKYTGSLTVTVNDPLTVSYDANHADSGTVPSTGTYATGNVVTVSGNTGGLARTGYVWLGWSTDPTASAAQYTASQTFVIGASSVTLYAIWAKDTTPPSSVTGVSGTTAATSVTLTWTDPADTDLAGIRVEFYGDKAGAVIVAKGVQTATISVLTSLVPYTFDLFAFDAANNFSAAATYWACPGGARQEDFACTGGVISGYTGTATNVVIPGSINGVTVTGIADNAFLNCTGLTSVTIPNSVTAIGKQAFYHCSGLTSVTIPNSLTAIGYEAFADCTGLTSVTIPDSVTAIGYCAFADCTGLTSVTIPDSVISIGISAFADCPGLTSLTIPNSVTSIGTYAFYYCYGLTSVTIPNSVTSIGTYAFGNCENLTSVTIPNSVTSIRDLTFADCSGLTSVTIPNSVTSIGDEAFEDCYGLTSVTIPNSVTSIGDEAFEVCYELTLVYVNATTPPTLGAQAFDSNGGGRIIYVPEGSMAAYQAAWPAYASSIEAQP